MKIALIPIDNRPVCYTLLKEIANIDNKLELFLPDRKFLGGLTSIADVNAIINWLEKLEEVDALVVSLDTIAYGGLISSRRGRESFEEVQQRLEKIKNLFKRFRKVYAFSSIMRISNNNVNEEEKEYWSEYGTRIFEYSYNFQKDGNDATDIPPEIINDYLATRYRNFKINKMYLDWLEEGIFETLVFSKDDCAEYGLNVMESESLDKLIQDRKLKGHVKTGADEIPLTLFARAVANLNGFSPKISPKFLAPEETFPNRTLISKYEDISIEKSVKSQIEISGCHISGEDEANIVILVNNFEEQQGEIVMGVKTQPFSGQFSLPKKPYLIADVRFANGADNMFVEKFFKKPFDFDTFYGYSAWNTSANTLGSLLCAGVVRFFAEDYNREAFRKLQLVRFLDDWAYQANVRQALKKSSQRPDVRKLGKLMLPFENKLKKLLRVDAKIKYKFPWKRYFEVEVIMK